MKKISFQEGISNLQIHSKLENVIIEENFEWRCIVKEEEEIFSDLTFSNCTFCENFGLYVATCRGLIKIQNCIIQNYFIFHNVFMYNDLHVIS